MYIRKTSQLDKKTGKPYLTHRLIESYRNAHDQPRQEMLVNLGTYFLVPVGLAEILMQCGFNEKQTGFALSSIIAKLVAPGSERSTHRYLTEQSALDELLNRDLSKLPLHGLYRIGDQIFNKKAAIESALYQREV